MGWIISIGKPPPQKVKDIMCVCLCTRNRYSLEEENKTTNCDDWIVLFVSSTPPPPGLASHTTEYMNLIREKYDCFLLRAILSRRLNVKHNQGIVCGTKAIIYIAAPHGAFKGIQITYSLRPLLDWRNNNNKILIHSFSTHNKSTFFLELGNSFKWFCSAFVFLFFFCSSNLKCYLRLLTKNL